MFMMILIQDRWMVFWNFGSFVLCWNCLAHNFLSYNTLGIAECYIGYLGDSLEDLGDSYPRRLFGVIWVFGLLGIFLWILRFLVMIFLGYTKTMALHYCLWMQGKWKSKMWVLDTQNLGCGLTWIDAIYTMRTRCLEVIPNYQWLHVCIGRNRLAYATNTCTFCN